MRARYSISALAPALLLGAFAAQPAWACCHGAVPKPAVPHVHIRPPTVSVPRSGVTGAVDSAVRDARDAAGRNTRRNNRSDRTVVGLPPKIPANLPPSEKRVYVLNGPDGKPLLGADGKPITVTVNHFNRDIPASQVKDVLDKERGRYGSSWLPNYHVLPNSEPTRTQDCAGLALEHVFGIKGANAGAGNFYNNVIVPTKAPEVSRTPGNAPINWDNVKDNDIGVMFYTDDRPGHIFIVQSAQNRTIITKDGNERIYTGTPSPFDEVHGTYEGDIAIYRIPPTVTASRK